MIAIKKHGLEKISSKNHNLSERIHKKMFSQSSYLVHYNSSVSYCLEQTHLLECFSCRGRVYCW